MSVPVCSRRVSAGITPAPGATSRLTVWWGADDWSRLEVPTAVWAHRDLCRAHHVEPATVVAVARGMAGFADRITGRDCRPTNARLTAAARCSLSTVQRARRVLKELGLVVEVTAGRSILTRSERLAAWSRGSSFRMIAAEFALCSRRARPVHRPDLRLVERDTPPAGLVVGTSAREIGSYLRSRTETRKPLRGAQTEKVRRRSPADPDRRPRRLVDAVKNGTSWLRGVHPQALTPLLSKFARQDWTARDVGRAIDGTLRARGHRVPTVVEHPAAYLASLLRDVDPADRPGAIDDEMRAMERRENAHQLLLATGAPCPHGRPGGDVPSPLRGQLACPECRAGVEDSLTHW